jgi:hypothetical protein
MKGRSSGANPCEDQAIYRCMDPHPWKGIQQKDCTKLKDKKTKKNLPAHKCGPDPDPSEHAKAPTYRECLPTK